MKAGGGDDSSLVIAVTRGRYYNSNTNTFNSKSRSDVTTTRSNKSNNTNTNTQKHKNQTNKIVSQKSQKRRHNTWEEPDKVECCNLV